MSLLVTDATLDGRREIAAKDLRPLAASLSADLRAVADRPIDLPAEKALLSREGGRCARDGSLLDFDPFNPHEHRCSRCGQVYRGELHDRFWIYWYQLWLAERAVHAAVLSTLDIEPKFGPLAETILDRYADRYLSYPNVDNVLGPTRVFFSTYLESIWLLQICIATDLISAKNATLAARVRERIIEPSRSIIAGYDEGGSNRQVWNDAALLAASLMLDDTRGAHDAVFGASGVVSQLQGGLLADGTWYEGENYHLFAHRGLWYGVTLASRAGLEIPPALLGRFQRGFATPFLTALPDFTFPSRRDSQYGVSLRQWRIAEHCELGIARADDPLLIGALQRMYCDDIPRRDTGRRKSSADVERNQPATSLTRADLSWRALLFARAELPSLDPVPPQSALLEAQGLAVFRRERGRVYVALDYGTSGGGHGHPDRLNLLLMDGEQRWLDDFGTGSYVEPSLHWYRSTLAHNAPLVNGVSQRPVDGVLLAHDERGAAGWISASAQIADTVAGTRTLIVMPEYVLDEMAWRASDDVVIDLPLHADFELSSGVDALESAKLEGGDGTADGFRFATDCARQRARGGVTVAGKADALAGEPLRIWARTDVDAEWWRVVAPGPPGAGDRAMRIIRSRSALGCYRSVLAWSAAVIGVEHGDTVRVTLADGSVHEHRRSDSGWHVELHAGQARSGIDLDGRRPQRENPTPPSTAKSQTPIELSANGRQTIVALGESHYRRSEQTWREAGEPRATVALSYRDRTLLLSIDVAPSERTFSPSDARNPYDNEHPDINGDGVQMYVSSRRGMSAWMLVPETDSRGVRVRQLEGWPDPRTIAATWSPTESGYHIDVRLENDLPTALDIIINEKPEGRERRRGQLVMSGAGGEFVYLRGDRHEQTRLIPLRVVDV